MGKDIQLSSIYLPFKRKYTPRAYEGFIKSFLDKAYTDRHDLGIHYVPSAHIFSSDPLDRIIYVKKAKFNPSLAMALWLAYRYDIDDYEFFAPYRNEEMKSGKIPGFPGSEVALQVENVMTTLLKNPFSNSAVFTLSQSTWKKGLTSFQFVVEYDQLNVVAMASNEDIVNELPYEMFILSMFWEYALYRLREYKLRPGWLSLVIGSLYLPVADLGVAQEIAKSNEYRWGMLTFSCPFDEKSMRELLEVYAHPHRWSYDTILTKSWDIWYKNWAFAALSYINRGVPDLSNFYISRMSDQILKKSQKEGLDNDDR